jgi:phosphoglycerate dehydrogenase-like enzyme
MESMPKILLTNHYSGKPFSIINAEIPAGFTLMMLDRIDKADLLDKIKYADYILVSGGLPIDKDILNAAVNLKMIQRTGVGTDTLDKKTIKEKGIPVYVNSGVNARSVAEHTIMLMLATLRNLTTIDANIRTGVWDKQATGLTCSELFGKSVGLIGMGNIGKLVAKILVGFDANLYYHSRERLSINDEEALQLKWCTVKELLEKVDIISLHCPLNDKTNKMIGQNEFLSIKPGAIIINTARGGLIDEGALIEALKTARIKGAGLDVFEKEPITRENPLLQHKNVILTPHIGGVTNDAFRRMMAGAMRNIRLFEEGNIELLESNRLKI